MDIKNIWETFLGMVKLENKSYTQAAKEPFSTALIILAIASLASALGMFWSDWNVTGLIGNAIGGFIGIVVVYAIFIGIVWALAKLLGGKGRYSQHYISASHIAVWSTFNIIPVVGQFIAGIGGLWGIVMNVFVIENVHKLSTGKAVLALFLPLIVIVFLAFALISTIMAYLVAAGYPFP